MHTLNKPHRLPTTIAALALLGTACTTTSNDDLAAVTTESTQATTTTTEATTTTTEATTTTTLTDEQAVRLVHTRFMTELAASNQTAEGGPYTDPDLIEELTTGRQRERLLETNDRYATITDYVISPGYDSNITHVEVAGDIANVLDCSEDRSVGYYADGSVETPGDGFFKIRGTRLVRIDGHWLVENFFTGGDDRCDPDQLAPTEATATEATLTDEEAVRLVHTRFMTELFASNQTAEGGPYADPELIVELTTGAQRERMLETNDRYATLTDYVENPGYDSNITYVEVVDNAASVLDCSQGRSVKFSADGQMVAPPDDFFKIRETRLVRLEGRWFVEEFFTGGDLRCEP